MKDKNIKVGVYREKFNDLTGQQLPLLDIMQSVPGLEKHINKRHPACLKYIGNISDIIQTPDYVGKHPKENNSIELVKVYRENIQIAVKLDKKNGYYFVASLYEVSEKKVQERLFSGRLQKFR